MLDFKSFTAEIDCIILPMQSLSAIQHAQDIMNTHKKSPDSESMKKETTCKFCILDAKYEKSDLHDIVKTYHQYLSETAKRPATLVIEVSGTF